MAKLALVRHGVSEYNAKGIWTGWDDPDLTEKGIEEARNAGEVLKDIEFDLAYTSDLLRAKHTLDEIKKVLKRKDLPTFEDKALRERNYGIYTRKNKWEIRKQVGEDEFKKIRRSWDHPIPEGESLKQVFERITPYFNKEILPKLKQGKNILISASGNSLRALKKHLENIPDGEIAEVEIATGEIHLYEVGKDGKILSQSNVT